MKATNAPKVSVCVVTYNHEKYIRRCLQGILDQKTDFDIEVIVGEDCSTDGTRAIVQEFAERYPDIVRPLLYEKNIGALKNYLTVHAAATGEYIAHCDGDDWVHPGKLYKQALYLDSHSECALVAHRMAICDAEQQVGTTRENSEMISLQALLRSHPMFLNSSIMYRREKIGDIFFNNDAFIDFYVYVTAALRGNICFINEVLGSYRRNIGISSGRRLMPYIQSAIDLAAAQLGETKEISRCRSRQYLSYAVTALLAKDMGDFRENLSRATESDRDWIVPKTIYLLGWYPDILKFMLITYKRIKGSYSVFRKN